MSQEDHWNEVYSTRKTEGLGWYRPHLEMSFALINSLGLNTDAPIIDIGGGASTLVDDLLAADYNAITVVDLSATALSAASKRLGEKGKQVSWLSGNVMTIDLPNHHFDLWHDRAAFHFLTEADQKHQYRDNLLAALKPGGHLVIGTFAPAAPARCSGLPVQRYTHEQLGGVLGEEFELMRHDNELHVTPGGVEQMYLYCLFRKRV